MKELLITAQKCHDRLLNDYQLLKEILYLTSKEERGKIKAGMESEEGQVIIDAILNPRHQPEFGTDALTFLNNLLKDAK